MKAMILAAGLGTRLKPLTDRIPKALVSVNGVTLLEIVLKRLIHAGYEEVIINLHHHGDQIRSFLDLHKNFGIRIECSDECNQLLDTGGGLQKASWFFDDGQPFLLHNVDILTDLDLSALRRTHMKNQPLATLAVRHRTSSRHLYFDSNYRLKGWTNHKTGEIKPAGTDLTNTEELAFSGIQILSPEIFKFMRQEGPYSMITLYTGLCREQPILGLVHDSGHWSDVGKPEELTAAEVWYKNNS